MGCRGGVAMNLRALEAQLCVMDGDRLRHVETVAEANGVLFLCPLCMAHHPDGVGVHMVHVLFAERWVPDNAVPGPGRWQASGTTIDDLSLMPSVHLTSPGGCGWHGWVVRGDAT